MTGLWMFFILLLLAALALAGWLGWELRGRVDDRDRRNRR